VVDIFSHCCWYFCNFPWRETWSGFQPISAACRKEWPDNSTRPVTWKIYRSISTFFLFPVPATSAVGAWVVANRGWQPALTITLLNECAPFAAHLCAHCLPPCVPKDAINHNISFSMRNARAASVGKHNAGFVQITVAKFGGINLCINWKFIALCATSLHQSSSTQQHNTRGEYNSFKGELKV